MEIRRRTSTSSLDPTIGPQRLYYNQAAFLGFTNGHQGFLAPAGISGHSGPEPRLCSVFKK
jgi:hypothetical protein